MNESSSQHPSTFKWNPPLRFNLDAVNCDALSRTTCHFAARPTLLEGVHTNTHTIVLLVSVIFLNFLLHFFCPIYTLVYTPSNPQHLSLQHYLYNLVFLIFSLTPSNFFFLSSNIYLSTIQTWLWKILSRLLLHHHSFVMVVHHPQFNNVCSSSSKTDPNGGCTTSFGKPRKTVLLTVLFCHGEMANFEVLKI